MLSATARPYIEASVPVLREHGLTITKAFYQNMLGSHPELQNLFNMGNSGFQNLGAAYDGLKLPATDLMQIGSMDEDLATRLKND